MVRITAVAILLASTVQSFATSDARESTESLVDNLINKFFAPSPADLDDTTLGKLRPTTVRQPELKPAPQPANFKAEVGNGFLKDGARKFAGAALAGLIAFAPVDQAHAAKSGGRVGGRAGFAAKAAAPRAAPPQAAAAPRTNVYVAPSIGIGGGYGMAASPFGYGYGYSPFGGMSTGTYLGLSVVETLMREQQRQAYLQQQLRTQEQLGRDQAQIAQLRSELKAQDSKVEGLKMQQTGGDAEKVKQLEQQLADQRKELEALKAKR